MPTTLVAPAAPPIAAPVAAAAPSGRIPALDRLRGLALAMMLVHHFVGWFTDRPRDVLPGLDAFLFTHLAAPAFAMTAGASLAILVGRADAKGTPRAEVTKMILRRYGILVPLGMVLGLVALANPFYFGVLDALGFGALITYGVLRATTNAWLRAAISAALFSLALPAQNWAATLGQGYAYKALAGKFPVLEFAGFTLVGALAAPHLRRWGRREPVGLAAALSAIALFFALAGVEPSRYPGGAAFVVPGLAGTAVLYATLCFLRPPAWLDRAFLVAGTRSLGIFVIHYALYVVLRQTDSLETLPPQIALGASLALTASIIAVAVRLPPLPFSLRKGSARRRSEVAAEEGQRVVPDIVPVGGAMSVAREDDEAVLDLRRP